MGDKKIPVWFVVAEVFLLFLLFQFSDFFVRLLKLPIPPALLGMRILFALLASGKVQVYLFDVSSRTLIRHLPLLLLPAIAGIIRFGPVLKQEGWKLSGILVMSTLVVLASTAGFARLTKKKKGDES